MPSRELYYLYGCSIGWEKSHCIEMGLVHSVFNPEPEAGEGEIIIIIILMIVEIISITIFFFMIIHVIIRMKKRQSN